MHQSAVSGGDVAVPISSKVLNGLQNGGGNVGSGGSSGSGGATTYNNKNHSSNTTTLGHDRQPSVQLKIQASGGPPLQIHTSLPLRIRRNVSYVASQFVVIVTQASPVVKSISLLLIAVYILQMSGNIGDELSLTPSQVISPSNWHRALFALATHIFLETRALSLVIDLLVISFCATLIEPLLGPLEVLKFILMSCIPSAFLTTIHYIILYCFTSNLQYLFDVHIHGFLPFYAAVFVSVKQLLPQSIIFSTSYGRFKNDHIPFTLWVGTLLLYFFNVLAGVQVIMFTYGLLSAWFYLRFLQAHVRHSISASGNRSATKTITRGDLSESFAFDTLFPVFLRPPITVLSGFIYNLLVKMKCCPKYARNTDSSQNGSIRTNYQYRPLQQSDIVQTL